MRCSENNLFEILQRFISGNLHRLAEGEHQILITNLATGVEHLLRGGGSQI